MCFTVVLAEAPASGSPVAVIRWDDAPVATLQRGADGIVHLEVAPRGPDEAWRFDQQGWLLAVTEARRHLA